MSMSDTLDSDESVAPPKLRRLLRNVLWAVIVVSVGTGVHLSLQNIIHSEGGPKEAVHALETLEQLEKTDPIRAAKVRAGMEKYNSICRLCHHRTGEGGKFTPPIAGKTEDGVRTLLQLYRSGERMGPMTDLMAPWAKDLSDEDIEILAAYVSTL